MCMMYKLVGLGDYTYKEKAKIKSKEIHNRKFKGVEKRENVRRKNDNKRKIL